MHSINKSHIKMVCAGKHHGCRKTLNVAPVPHGVSGTYRGHPPSMNQGLLLQFFDFLKAEVFLREIYLAAKI